MKVAANSFSVDRLINLLSFQLHSDVSSLPALCFVHKADRPLLYTTALITLLCLPHSSLCMTTEIEIFGNENIYYSID